MPPYKKNQNSDPSSGPKTRRQVALEMDIEKRKANASPAVKKPTKRSAFGDLTNAVDNSTEVNKLCIIVKKEEAAENDLKKKNKMGGLANKQTSMKQYCKLVKPSVALQSKVLKPKIEEVTEKIKTVSVTEPSLPSENQSTCTTDSEDSIYVSAEEEVEAPKTADVPEVGAKKKDEKANEIKLGKLEKKAKEVVAETKVQKPEDAKIALSKLKRIAPLPEMHKVLSKVPHGVRNHDLEVWSDPLHSSIYAMDIFNYLKNIEGKFAVDHYLPRQPGISQWMRALLVDWMVELQETFEMNHETLYLAVKLVDLYLSKNAVSKDTLQLVGAASFLIATKFDEQVAIGVQDIIFICDGAFSQREIVRMEKNILKSLDFNLGIPLSYVFLRRYALCGRISMKQLTLARFILEMSLMEYSFVKESESKMAASALLLAILMFKEHTWNPSLQYYSGYRVHQLRKLAEKLNEMLQYSPKEKLATIRIKYSHKSFFEVAKVPALQGFNFKKLVSSAPTVP